MIWGLLLAAALGGDAFPDADLPRFQPARAGMVSVMRFTDPAGKPLMTTTQVTARVDRPDGTLGRLLARTREVHAAGGERSRLQECAIYPDRLEAAELESDREPTVELKTPLAPGTSWTYPLAGGQGKRQILGVEEVCVAAGTFKRALHVRVRSRYELDGLKRELASDLWYAPDAGLVKVVVRDPRTGQARILGELVSLKQDPTPTRRP